MLTDAEVNKLVIEYIQNGRKDKQKCISRIMESSMMNSYYINNEEKYDIAVDKLLLGGDTILDKFDPEKVVEGGFCGYLKTAVNNKYKSIKAKETNDREKGKEVVVCSINDVLKGKDGKKDREREELYGDTKSITDEDVDLSATMDFYIDAIKIMLSKRKPESKKIVWEQLFATETITHSVHKNPKMMKYIIENEKRCMSVMSMEFANTYLINDCVTIADIAKSELHSMKHFGKDSDNKCGYALIGAVYAKYTGKSEAAVSQQREIYRNKMNPDDFNTHLQYDFFNRG